MTLIDLELSVASVMSETRVECEKTTEAKITVFTEKSL